MTGPVIGVDGCPRGWALCIADPGDPPAVRFEFRTGFADVAAAGDAVGAEAIAVDMPIGLPTDTDREADSAARSVLGRRASSIFSTPALAVLAASDYDEAKQLSTAAIGKMLSRQTWALVPKIREVRANVSPEDTDRYVEAHPEVSFACMVGSVLAKKTSAGGIIGRIAALRNAFPGIEAALAAAPESVPLIDALDAAACAWTARRVRSGTARVFGDGYDPAGYPLTITA